MPPAEPEPSITVAALVDAAHIDRVEPPRDLVAWLLEQRLAIPVAGGRLAPTSRAVDIVTGLDPSLRPWPSPQ